MTGAIATPHTLATEAGRRAYEAGGNAVDAALAAAITTAVVYPHNTSPGGDVIALLRTPDGTVHCVNASGWAPAAHRLERLRERHGERLPARGIDTVTVPGAVAGWAALAGLGARLPWEAHFDHAITHARAGFGASHSLAFCLSMVWREVCGDPGLAAIFGRDGRPIMRGEPIVQPALAETLGTIAAQGPGAMYGGAVGEALIGGLRPLGGVFERADFDEFRAETVAPISRPFGDLVVHTSPPNTQGFALLRTLAALQRDPGGNRWTLLAESFFEGNQLRDRHLADPRFAEVRLDALIDGPTEVAPTTPTARPHRPTGDTIGLVTADDDGYAVSLIQSVFKLFGAGILEPTTGLIVQDRGASFSLESSSPNRIGPRKRPAHTLMPVLATHRGGLRFANATMGGTGQPMIHTQLLLRLLQGATPQEAVAAPRFVVGPNRPGDTERTLYAEAGVPDEAIGAFLARGFHVVSVPDRTELLGHANVIAVGPDGRLLAGSDPRADGRAEPR